MKQQNSHFLGRIFNKKHNSKIEVKADLIEYEENGIHFVYSPAFDLVGYGTTSHEARQSWEAVLEEYFNYTLNKNTLIKDLQNKGWEVKKKRHFNPPTLSWMLQNNDQLTDIYNNHNFKKVTQPISVPLAYA